MAKSIAKSCPLCLSVNDPADMLPVTMEHSTPPQTAPMYLCRLCVIQIMKSTLQSDVVDPGEVFGAIAPAAEIPAVSEPESEPLRGLDAREQSNALADAYNAKNRPEPKLPAGDGTSDESDSEG